MSGAGEIPGVLDQGQGCPGARAGTVTVEWTKSGSRLFIEYRCHSVSAHASKTKLRPAADRKVTLRHQEVLVRPGHPEGVFTFDVAPS